MNLRVCSTVFFVLALSACSGGYGGGGGECGQNQYYNLQQGQCVQLPSQDGGGMENADMDSAPSDMARPVVSDSANCNPYVSRVVIADRITAGQVGNILLKHIVVIIPSTDGARPPLPCQAAHISQITEKWVSGSAIADVKDVVPVNGAGTKMGAVIRAGKGILKPGDVLTFNVTQGGKLNPGENFEIKTLMDGSLTGPSTALTVQTDLLSIVGAVNGKSLSLNNGPSQTIFFTN